MSELKLTKNKSKTSDFLECEKTWVFAVLMFVAGYYGCYTLIRFGVFCNAQTANFVFFAKYIGQGNWPMVLQYVTPMVAYFLGAAIPEIFASKIKKLNVIRWDTFVVVFEIICVLIMAFLPLSADKHITMIMINFICSVQFTTFRRANNRVMATTFCTAHWRQVGVSLVKTIKHRSKNDFYNFLAHFIMVLTFVIGAIISSIITTRLMDTKYEAYSVLVVLIPLIILLVDFLRADLFTERDRLNTAPRGH